MGGAAMTVFLYWLPRSDSWLRSREKRRAMVPYSISAKRFEQMERTNEILLPLVGLIVTVALFIKLVAETL